jgi:DNA-binding LacI/PurR family transcriptional regulator
MPASYISLPHQVAELIKSGIESKRWVNRLPGERVLVQELGVSRRTIRQALTMLRSSKLIKCETGRGHKILPITHYSKRGGTIKGVGLIISSPVELQRTFTNLWINELRSFLANYDINLRVFSGKKYYSGSPGKTLAKLIHNEPQRAWVITESTAMIQNWFESNHVNSVIVGSPHGETSIPSVDLDYRAVGRHAAGEFLRAGHRCIAIMIGDPARGGDNECVAGFEAAIKAHQTEDIDFIVARHTLTPESIFRSIQILLRRKTTPTAMLVGNSPHYLTVHTAFCSLGLKIPENITLISRDDDPYLRFVHPEPARYSCPPVQMAKRVGRIILKIHEASIIKQPPDKLMPTFLEGATLSKRID